MTTRYEQTSGQSAQIPGFYLLKPGSGMRTMKPKWDKSTTKIRILPKPLGEDGIVPFKENENPKSFTDWIRAYPIASYIGEFRKLTFIDAFPLGGDLYQTPLQVLVNTVRKKPQGFGVSWDNYVDMKAWNAPIKSSRITAFVQVLLLAYDGVDLYAHGKTQSGIVFMLSKSATDALEILLAEEDPNFQGSPTDYTKRYTYGSFLTPDKGRVIGLTQNEANSSSGDTAAHANKALNLNDVQGGSVAPVRQVSTYRVTMGNVLSVEMSAIKALWRDWDDIVRILDPDKQVELLCTAFPPNLMRAAFSNTDWLPASIKTGRSVVSPPSSEAPRRTSQPNSLTAGADDETPNEAHLDLSQISDYSDAEDDMPRPDSTGSENTSGVDKAVNDEVPPQSELDIQMAEMTKKLRQMREAAAKGNVSTT